MLSRTHLLFLAGLLALGTLASLGVCTGFILAPGYARLEEQRIHEHLQRFRGLVDFEVAGLASSAEDYATWDETVRFLGRPSSRWEEGLSDRHARALRADLMLVRDARGHILASRLGEQGRLRPLPPSLAGLPGPAAEGLLVLEGRPMLVAARPVRGARQAVLGSFAVGRFLDAAELGRLQGVLHWKLDLLPAEAWRMGPQGDERIVIRSRKEADGLVLMRDLAGRPAFVARLAFTRRVHALEWTTLGLLLGCASAFLVFTLWAGHLLLLKLRSLRRDRREVIARFESVVAHAAEGIVLVDAEGWDILEANGAFLEMAGLAGGLEGRTRLSRFLSEQDCRACAALVGGPRRSVEAQLLRSGAPPLDVELSAGLLPHAAQPMLAVLVRDVSERKRYEEALRHRATHDALTGLCSRVILRDRLQQALAVAQDAGRELAVLVLDLDRFKALNESFGYAAGDEVLRASAARLRRLMGPAGTVSRVGGDEFAVVLPGLEGAESAARMAQRVVEAFSAPFVLEEGTAVVTASVGLSLFPRHGREAEALLRYADLAAYQAKERGRNGFLFFEPEMSRVVEERMRLESALHGALEAGEFRVVYQPRALAATGRIVGMEALLRWQPRDAPVVSPALFVPVLEETGGILPVGAWVLREACRRCRAWTDEGAGPLRVGVNLSGRQFRQPDLGAQVEAALAEAGLPAAQLVLEVTEGVMLDDVEAAAAQLQALRALGVGVALDDFGTGYSSLSYLRRLPVDDLKIDQSFVRRMKPGGDDAVLVANIVRMAHDLHMRVVAEGVETDVQRALLHEAGCEELQGYLVGRPMDPEAFQTLLGRRLVALA